MGRILTFLVIAYVIFMLIRLALRYFVHDKERSFLNKNDKKKKEYDKSKVVDATFEEIK
jgi:large-conductance mechanosensitive channel